MSSSGVGSSNSTGPLSKIVAEAFGVRDRVVIVTGAAGWIGGGIAAAFLANGAKVVLTDQAGERLEGKRGEVAEAGEAAMVHATNLAVPEELTGLVNAVLARFGKVDALINCAAIPTSAPIRDEREENFDQYYHVNVRAPWLLCKRLVEPMEKNGGGSIVNIASVNAHRPMFAASLYCGTKASLLAMTRELAVELAPAMIRVNSVSPGVIMPIWHREKWARRELQPAFAEAFLERFGPTPPPDTRSGQPLSLTGHPLDVAMACVYLCSPAARFVTGADLAVDGGMLQAFPPPLKGGSNPLVRDFLLALPAEAWKNGQPHWIVAQKK